MHILLVEKDRTSTEYDDVQKWLNQDGYTVERLTDREITISAIKTKEIEVILLDLSLFSIEGASIVGGIRAKGIKTPIFILLNSSPSIKDKVQAFDGGADGYLNKPVDLPELSARIRALKRRYSNNRASPLLTYQDIELNPSSLTVTLKGEPVNFSRSEFNLLQKLLENVGRIVSRNSLNQCLYSWADEIVSNTLEVHVHNIRKKLGITNLIHTIRGIGYMMEKKN